MENTQTLTKDFPATDVKTHMLKGICIRYTDGDLWVDLDAVHALSWDTTEKQMKSAGHGGDPIIPKTKEPTPGGVFTTAVGTEPVTKDKPVTICYWDGDEWVCGAKD